MNSPRLTDAEVDELEARAKRAEQGPFTNHVEPSAIFRLITEIREARKRGKDQTT